MKNKLLGLLAIVLIPLLSFSNYLFAVGSSGIENASFSAEALAQGNAVVAQANEPAAISYNPAGIIDLPGLQIQSNVNFLSILTTFKSRTPSTVPGEKSSATIVPVPTAYMTLNPGEYLDNRVAFGIGTDSPFGLINKFDADHPIVRYAGWKNWFRMYTIKPTVAFKITDWLSIGGGPMWYRVFDWGGIQAYPNVLVGAGADGQVRVNLAGQHWGWQMGALAKPHKQHQFGFYFRSPVVVNTSGLAKVERGAVGTNFETGIDAKYTLPLNFTWAYAFKPIESTTIEFDFGYTRWSTFERLFINHNTTGVAAADTTVINAIGRNNKDFRDSFNYHLGFNHQLTEKIKLMMGGWYYTHAAPNSSFIPAISDSDRLGVGAGFNYKIGKYIVFGFTYVPSWNIPRRINNDVAVSLGVSEDGRYFTWTNEMAVSLTYKWENLFDRFKKTARMEKSAKVTESVPAVA